MQGYYRYPAIFQDKIVFVADDDIWMISGNNAQRLTTSRGLATTPIFSPDGTKLAFASSDEGGLEIFTFDLMSGDLKRLTYLGHQLMACTWTQDGIYFSAPHGGYQGVSTIWRVQETGGIASPLYLGPSQNIDFNRHGSGAVLQRHGYREFGYWKRYRGGTTGEIWIDQGDGVYKPLLHLKSNLAKPLWVKGRIYFSSDHEGIGNLYSCTPQGIDIKRHTHHTDYYVRNQATDGHTIVYHGGGDLYRFDPTTDTSTKIEFTFTSPKTQRQRKWVEGDKTVYDYALHSKGQHLASTHRGKLLAYNAFEGPVVSLQEDKKRYRLCTWLKDDRLLVSHDKDHEDVLEIVDKTMQSFSKSPLLNLGRLTHVRANPHSDHMAFVNHRAEVGIISLKTWTVTQVDRSPHGDISGIDWSPDGQWLAYDCTLDRRRTAIKLFSLEHEKTYQITHPVLRDVSPTFDPEGKYIYFLSYREFQPTYDTLHFDLSFPAGMRPYLITLREDIPHPFIPVHESEGFEEKEDKDDKEEKEDKDEKQDTPEPLIIDLDTIHERVVALPIEPGHFSHPTALKGKLVYLSHPLVDSDEDTGDDTGIVLESFDMETQKTEEFIHNIAGYTVSLNRKHLMYQTPERLRIIKALEKPDDNADTPKKSGWVNTKRLRFMVDPSQEWEHIFNETWRLQKDHFWVEDMSDVNWEMVYTRYAPLVKRVASRHELTDVLYEMHGELGTSHAYVVGGDVKISPQWRLGFLGARFTYDTHNKCHRIDHLMKGDTWSRKHGSPLAAPGIRAKVGDKILAINGQPINQHEPIEAHLVAKANQDVLVTLEQDKILRHINVPTLTSQHGIEYRDWVNKNRAYVHEKSQGRVGYIHIPDMGAFGYAEFHRGFLAECDYHGLIVDVRFNGGGHVSSLLLEKLARKRLGYDISRWSGSLPYPTDSTHGRMVGLINEFAGSDGDVFASMFKSMNLGPLIGKRTWGGVIGYWAKHNLIDNGYTTQPEYSLWTYREGWKMENHGVDPDIEIDITPQDYIQGHDPQLDQGLKEVLSILDKDPVTEPDFSEKPKLTLPQALLSH